MAGLPWRCRQSVKTTYQPRNGTSTSRRRFRSMSRNPERAGVDSVPLHLQMQRLVVHPKQSRCLTLVATAGLKRQPDRLAFGLGDDPTGDLLQRWALVSASRAV